MQTLFEKLKPKFKKKLESQENEKLTIIIKNQLNLYTLPGQLPYATVFDMQVFFNEKTDPSEFFK